jgi:hypothetical protein
LTTLVRARFVHVYERRDELTIVDHAGRAQRLTGDSATLARAVLDHLRTPQTPDDVRAHVAELTGSRDGLAVVDELLMLLQTTGVVVANERAPDPPRGANVVLAIGGGVVAAHAPALTELLLGRGHRVRVCATKSALRFVRSLPLRALTHERVIKGLWPRGELEIVPHLALARWADVTLVYPATATTLSRIARGDCSTIVSAVAISTRKPVVLVPAMNSDMFDAPAVQRNLAQLRDDGFVIMHPSRGYEVAESPTDRAPSFGAAPPLPAIVDVVDVVLRAP